jgi:hypothetical protein
LLHRWFTPSPHAPLTTIPHHHRCANRGGFTIWPNGGGYTFGRFDVVRNSCKFEKIDLIESSSKGKTYKARVACDNSGEDDDDPEDHEIKHIDLIIHTMAFIA